MEHRIETLPEKKLIGMRMTMSFANNKTSELWKSFMPKKNEIPNAVSADLYSLQTYPLRFFDHFNPHLNFEKWAAREVSKFENIPPVMETLVLPGGLYAVFLYRGASSAAAPFFQYILGTWLPNSYYALDDRSHFEILSDKYKDDHPDSEEEVWIPVKL